MNDEFWFFQCWHIWFSVEGTLGLRIQEARRRSRDRRTLKSTCIIWKRHPLPNFSKLLPCRNEGCWGPFINFLRSQKFRSRFIKSLNFVNVGSTKRHCRSVSLGLHQHHKLGVGGWGERNSGVFRSVASFGARGVSGFTLRLERQIFV